MVDIPILDKTALSLYRTFRRKKQRRGQKRTARHEAGRSSSAV